MLSYLYRCIAAIFLLTGGLALAMPVEPGQSGVVGGNEEFVPPSGDIVADKTQPITFSYIPPAGWTFDPGETPEIPATLRSAVVRDAATQFLTFYYLVDYTPERQIGKEGGEVTLSNFSGFTTDLVNSSLTKKARSADGATLTLTLTGEGITFVGGYSVATNATDFDDNGVMTIHATDEFGLLDEQQEHVSSRLGADVRATGMYQPVAAEPPSAIPLPAGVWPGTFALTALFAASHLRAVAHRWR